MCQNEILACGSKLNAMNAYKNGKNILVGTEAGLYCDN